MNRFKMRSGWIFDIKKYALHDGPGIRTTIFMKGCPLKCRWCHNPEGISPEPELMFTEQRCLDDDDCIVVCPESSITKKESRRAINTVSCTLCDLCTDICDSGALEKAGKEMTVAGVMAEIEKDVLFFDESGGGVTFSGGEPMMQLEFLKELLRACKAKSIHTTVDTSGYADPEHFEALSGLVDLYLYDFKVFDSGEHFKHTGVSNDLIKKNLTALSESGEKIIIRIPVIPGLNDSKKNCENTVEFFKTMPGLKRVDLLEYHSWGSSKLDRLGRSGVDYGDSNGSLKTMNTIFEEFDFTVYVGG